MKIAEAPIKKTPGAEDHTNHSTGLAEAERFLHTLDHRADGFHFRTFDDKRRRGSLPRKFYGPIADHYNELRLLNERGAGVFVVMNSGGQTKDEIDRVRVVFADTDGAPLEPIVEALPPHIVVQSSPGKWHAYYRVHATFPLETFGPVQVAIAEKFGTDPAVKDLPRVMRLPGFKHNKAEPFIVTITHLDAARPAYSLERIITGLGLNLGDRKRHEISSTVPAGLQSITFGDEWKANAPARTTTLEEAGTMLRYIDPDCDRGTWWKVMGALAHEFGEDARELARRWSMGLLRGGAA